MSGFYLTGCITVTEREATPDSLNLTEPFTRSGEEALRTSWWLEFEDSELNILIGEALSSNLTLRSTWARLAQTEAILKRSTAPLFPSLSVTGTADTTERHEMTGNEGDSYSASASAGYEIDLWSRIRNAKQAARLDRDASRESLQAAAITLTAQIAGTHYQLVEQRAQLDILDDQIATLSDTLEVIQTRFRRGQVDSTDVLQQQRLLEGRKGNRYDVEARIAVLEHALAVLLGRNPVDASFESAATFPEIPPLPDSGIPAQLVQRRPDVRSAFYELLSADRRVAVAVADQFPALRLTGSIRSNETAPGDLFNSWVATLAANLSQPLFDGGSRRAEVLRTRAQSEIQLNNYTLTVLSALQEVEDALIQEDRQAQTIESLEKQLLLARAVVDQTRTRYLRGAESFLRVLDAQQTLQSLERSLITARRQRVEFRINLARALAGGVDLVPPDAYPRYPNR